MKKTLAALAVAFAASSAVPAFAAEQAKPAAQQMQAKHHGHHCGSKCAKHHHEGMAAKQPIAANKLPASVRAYMKSNDKMHREMMLDYTGNADVDFAHGMIAHHKGAIGMAEVELKYGKDAEMRALAKDIIAAQKKEIRQMEAWAKLKRHAAESQAKAEKKAAKEQVKAAHKAAKTQAKTAK